MNAEQLQDLCEQGQCALMATDYLQAEKILADAERIAWTARDFDTLSRLYMPLQEARRQKRQHCGEGFVCLDLTATSADDLPDPQRILDTYRRGTLLVAGWGSIEPAIRIREIAERENLYLDTFLAAAYSVGGGIAVMIVPTINVAIPAPGTHSIDALVRTAPVGALVLNLAELPRGARPGTPDTYGQTMAMWEKLHAPFLADADATADPIRKIEAYRKAIRVDYACELAHQHLSRISRELARGA